MVELRALTLDDGLALEALLLREPSHNLFHLSALVEFGLAPASDAMGKPWAVGFFRDGALAGMLMALRGTGSIFHTPGDSQTLGALAGAVVDKSMGGGLSLLSGHASQLGPLFPLVQARVSVARPDHCYFCTLLAEDIRLPPRVKDFGAPRIAEIEDLERLIDFYEVGFYSLAHLPSRAAWESRLSEQLAYRTLFLVEDRYGRVASAALTSAEGGRAAMIGGVATLEKYRGKGLSALCVGAMCEYLFTRNIGSISLFYLRDNVAAGRVYDKLGFGYDGEWLLASVGFAAAFGPLLGPRGR